MPRGEGSWQTGVYAQGTLGLVTVGFFLLLLLIWPESFLNVSAPGIQYFHFIFVISYGTGIFSNVQGLGLYCISLRLKMCSLDLG